MARDGAQRRYTNTVLMLSVAYMLILFAVVYLFNNAPPTGIAAYAAAVLPALPIIGIFAAIGRYLIDEQDEYVGSLMVRQTLWASGFAVRVATVWGLLESFEVVGHVEAFYIAVVWFFGLGVGSVMNRLTLGDTGHC